MSDNGQEIQDIDFHFYKDLGAPTTRAAYSDRMSWILSALSELAYMRFESAKLDDLISVASNMLDISGRVDISGVLNEVISRLRAPGSKRKRLEILLQCAGFELLGEPISDVMTDTQCFVVYRKGDATRESFVAIIYRGTESMIDWLKTNLDFRHEDIGYPASGAYAGKMHRGFLQAYRSVADQIQHQIDDPRAADLPIYVAGHSLGGALAIVTAWHIPSARLAACYTYGSPRVGNKELVDKFHTPIYRIINAADPVPMVPMSHSGGAILKAAVRVVLRTFNHIPLVKIAAKWVDKIPTYADIGHEQYFTFVSLKARENNDYSAMRLEFATGTLKRLWRYFARWREGNALGMTKYHDISEYRRKLRIYALWRNGMRDPVFTFRDPIRRKQDLVTAASTAPAKSQALINESGTPDKLKD